MSPIVGIDVAKHSVALAIELDNGKHRTKAKLANDPKGFATLHAWLCTHAQPDSWVVMEATGIYHQALAEFLYAHGYRVCVLNPAQVALYARRQLQRVKTDRSDAKLIASYGLRHRDQLRAWHPDPPALKTLKALVRRRDDLLQMLQMERNRLEVAQANGQPSIQGLIDHLHARISEIQQAIEDHIDQDPDLRRQRSLLTSIDGIGDISAALLLAELGPVKRLADAAAVTAVAGLNRRLHESGRYQGKVCICRTGSARLRAGLYMPALVAMRHNPVVTALKQRLHARGKHGKQIVCAAMRKLLHLAYGVLKSGTAFDPHNALAR
ncbi:IS110 family transposase [Xanthomonas vasicola]|uniref:IS110 family transposase n=1 Tax=Xanthomonas vasicola TaxID=56459 RepID=UPI0005318593|nr:IS110 family transposase [Xanthomonas vasicola]KGR42989.1 transposase [Xanthomonas vasicola]